MSISFKNFFFFSETIIISPTIIKILIILILDIERFKIILSDFQYFLRQVYSRITLMNCYYDFLN